MNSYRKRSQAKARGIPLRRKKSAKHTANREGSSSDHHSASSESESDNDDSVMGGRVAEENLNGQEEANRESLPLTPPVLVRTKQGGGGRSKKRQRIN